jgi:hypothetical protein
VASVDGYDGVEGALTHSPLASFAALAAPGLRKGQESPQHMSTCSASQQAAEPVSRGLGATPAASLVLPTTEYMSGVLQYSVHLRL